MEVLIIKATNKDAMRMKKTNYIGKVVIVRTSGAGVHVGKLIECDGQRVVLNDAVRVWRWRGANTLHELSLNGADMESYTRISEPVPSILLTTAIEIIPCSKVASKNLMVSRWLSE